MARKELGILFIWRVVGEGEITFYNLPTDVAKTYEDILTRAQNNMVCQLSDDTYEVIYTLIQHWDKYKVAPEDTPLMGIYHSGYIA